jgi:hypothetical protein
MITLSVTQQGHGSTDTTGASRDVVGIKPTLGSQDSCASFGRFM